MKKILTGAILGAVLTMNYTHCEETKNPETRDVEVIILEPTKTEPNEEQAKSVNDEGNFARPEINESEMNEQLDALNDEADNDSHDVEEAKKKCK